MPALLVAPYLFLFILAFALTSNKHTHRDELSSGHFDDIRTGFARPEPRQPSTSSATPFKGRGSSSKIPSGVRALPRPLRPLCVASSYRIGHFITQPTCAYIMCNGEPNAPIL